MSTWSKLRNLSPLAGADKLLDAFLAANQNPVQDASLAAASRALENSEGVDIGHGMRIDPTNGMASGVVSKELLKRTLSKQLREAEKNLLRVKSEYEEAGNIWDQATAIADEHKAINRMSKNPPPLDLPEGFWSKADKRYSKAIQDESTASKLGLELMAKKNEARMQVSDLRHELSGISPPPKAPDSPLIQRIKELVKQAADMKSEHKRDLKMLGNQDTDEVMNYVKTKPQWAKYSSGDVGIPFEDLEKILAEIEALKKK